MVESYQTEPQSLKEEILNQIGDGNMENLASKFHKIYQFDKCGWIELLKEIDVDDLEMDTSQLEKEKIAQKVFKAHEAYTKKRALKATQ